MEWTRALVNQVYEESRDYTRKEMAKRLGIPVTALDAAIRRYAFHFRPDPRQRGTCPTAASSLSPELRQEIAEARAESIDMPPYKPLRV